MTTLISKMQEITKPEPTSEEPGRSAFFMARGRRFLLSVRVKGMIVLIALVVYSSLIALFAFQQKNLLLRDFEEIQQVLSTEAMLKQADISTFHALMAIFVNIDASDRAEGQKRIQMHYQSLLHRHEELAANLPRDTLDLTALNKAWEEVSRDSSSASLNHLSAELIKVKGGIESLAQQVHARHILLSGRYRTQIDSIVMSTFVLGMLGLGLLGAITGLFFRRLTDDLRMLQSRALDIVKGFRGKPIEITRHDEIGQLMMAVNDMAETLDRREKELMLERQKYFHQEKMAAIGGLAAGVSHEIGNPIAAIAGIAQAMVERRAAGGGACKGQQCDDCRPELIHAQTQRLAAITREISDFASPRAIEPQLLDLNEQLRRTSSLVRFDKRLHQVALRLDLDSQLPAIVGIADQLTQLIMNLLINAMDALEGIQDRAPAIVIATHADPERVCLLIEDNGHGIEPDILGRIFEAFFTTKPAGKGTGLGLSLCYSIVNKHGGTIEIDSTPGTGTRVQVFFPLDDSAFSEVRS